MISTKLAVSCVFMFGILGLVVLGPSLQAQTTVDGRVMDSKNNAVGGVDVALYVVGNKDPIISQTSDPKTGEYRFANLRLTGAFDIVYTHAKYDTATVSRLAERDNQHVSKVIYLKGERKPVTAVHEQFLSARRLAFLANALDNKDDRQVFVSRFSALGIWEALDHNIDEMSSEKLSDRMRKFLETERQQTMSLRAMLQ